MTDNQATSSREQKRCFVVMGFGHKTDLSTGRLLDLDKSYRLLIKPVAEEKGLKCIRADEIPHSGIIDVPMYQELLMADIVIADLSTANANALYELGIRHALRPWTTIVISENKLPYPFDLNHVTITSYTHLGDAIDYDEVMRFRKVLGDTLQAVLGTPKTDSPVYTFLNTLTPPSLGGQAAEAVAKAGQALQQAGKAIAEVDVHSDKSVEPGRDDKTLAAHIEEGETAIKESRFSDAVIAFEQALHLCPENSAFTQDPYLLQRLVLATYKAKQPDEVSALNKALELLDTQLNLKDSNDPETVGLSGAIEKRLFDKGQGEAHLDRAIRCYARGYFLRNDRYNGINLAFLLNVRTAIQDTKECQIADLVWANRLRREVLDLCVQELQEIRDCEERRAERGRKAPPDKLEEQTARDKEQKFWCLATKAEAHFGLGELDAYERTRSEAETVEHASWMMGTFDQQISKLRSLLEKHGHLLNPPWPIAPSN